jgi:hypothetical protein
MLASDVPSHQDAEGTPVNPIPRNGINAQGTHSFTRIEQAGDDVYVTPVAVVNSEQGRPSRAERDAYTQALEALYWAAGARGDTFASTYAQHKGTKEIVFTAWQEGRRAAQEKAT